MRKRKKLNNAQLFTFTHAAHTSLLILSTYVKPANLHLYARKIYALMAIHLKKRCINGLRKRKKLRVVQLFTFMLAARSPPSLLIAAQEEPATYFARHISILE